MYDTSLDLPVTPDLAPTGIPRNLFERALQRSMQKIAPKPVPPPVRPERDTQHPPGAAADTLGALSDPASMRARAAQLAHQQDNLVQSILGTIAAPPPASPTYAPPERQHASQGEGIGLALAALLNPRGFRATEAVAAAGEHQRDQQFADDTARAQAGYQQQRDAAADVEHRRDTDLLRTQTASTMIGNEVTHLLGDAEKAEHDRALESATLTRLANDARRIDVTQSHFTDEFTIARERLGWDKDKTHLKIDAQFGLQAARDSARLTQIGVRADAAMKLAQLRATTQWSLQSIREIGVDRRAAAHEAGLDRRADASNDVRRQLAQDRDWQRTAQSSLTQISGYIRSLQSANPKERAAAIQRINGEMSDPSSSLGVFMGDLKRRGLMGEPVAAALEAEIRDGLNTPGAAAPGTTVNVNVAPGASASAGAAPAARPAGTPPTMPSAPSTPSPGKHEPTQDEVNTEARSYRAAHPHASNDEIKKHLEQWVTGHSSGPK